MELLLIMLALCALGLLAARFGYDSRDRVRSAEERFSAQGLTWGGSVDPPAAAQHAIGRSVARVKPELVRPSA